MLVLIVAMTLVDIALFARSADGLRVAVWEYLTHVLGGFAHITFIAVTASSLAQRISKKLLRTAISVALVAPAISLLAAKWLYLGIVGEPVGGALVAFAARQPGQILLHLAQTSPSLLGLAALLSAAVSVLLVEAFRDLKGSSLKHSPRLATLLSVACVITTFVSTLIGGELHRRRAFGWMTNPAADAAARRLLREKEPRPESTAVNVGMRPSVVVVLVESLRHDLSDAFPLAVRNLASIANDGIRFERAYATASHSDYSDLALWYSQYPLRHSRPLGYPIGAQFRRQSIFEVFRDAGYHTAYFSSQNERWGGMINWIRGYGIDKFFHSETFQGSTWENLDDAAGLARLIKSGVAKAGKVEDSETLRAAQEYLARNAKGSPFFVGLNLQNTHFSYVQTPGYSNPFGSADFDFPAIYYRWPNSRVDVVKRRYLNSVANVDSLLGSFVDFLKQHELWENMIFVVVGDNGEAFHEHGFGNHSGPMYDEAVRTFSFIKPHRDLQLNGSGVASVSIPQPVSHIDISATAVALAGLKLPASFQGRSVFDSSCRLRPVYMHTNAVVMQNAVVSWPWKYMRTAWPNLQEELYNLADDPRESRNVVDIHRRTADSLSGQLLTWTVAQNVFYDEQLFRSRPWPSYCQVSNSPPIER